LWKERERKTSAPAAVRVFHFSAVGGSLMQKRQGSDTLLPTHPPQDLAHGFRRRLVDGQQQARSEKGEVSPGVERKS